MAKKIDKKALPELLNQWAREFAVLVPARVREMTIFDKWDGKNTGFLEWYRNTARPAKASFFLPMEEMFRFHKDKDGYHVEQPNSDQPKQLIFGVRPCDAKALAILDLTFKDGYEDPYYLSRRKNSVLVGLSCTEPYDSCFCTSLGGSPSDSSNVDLMVTDIGDELLIEEISDKGKELLARTEGLEKATKANEAKAKKIKEEAAGKITRAVETKDVREKLLACFENKDYWEKVSAKCLTCGICTFLCPTCYCFDINDEIVNNHGERLRCWDSCAFSIYTKMPAENPREQKWRRVRQKLCHKYEFYPTNYDVIACTGCGRCIRLCPVNWDITQTLNSLPAKAAKA